MRGRKVKGITAVSLTDTAVYKKTFYNAALSVGLNNKSAAKHSDAVQISDIAKSLMSSVSDSEPSNTENALKK